MKRVTGKKAYIKTERLTLKPYSEEDLQRLVFLLRNEEITRTFMVPDYETEEEYFDLARKLVSFSRLEDTAHLEIGIYLDGELIGFINDCGIGEDEIEIGYVMDPAYQGRGYTTEAVRAILKELKEMGFRKVTAGYFEENEASHRVMEKCGMHLTQETDEEEYRGEIHCCRVCEILFS